MTDVRRGCDVADDNTLEVGRPRVGFLADGDPATPPLPAQLVRTASDIELRLPWLDDQPSDRHLQRWFSGDARWGDDPDKSQYRYAPPVALEFADALGRVVLVGCWSRGYRRVFGLAGEGRIGVTYALPGASNARRYLKINGLRSQIDGLGSWYRHTVVVTKPVLDEKSRVRAVDLHAEAPAETPVSRHLNLTLRPDFRVGPGQRPDDTVVSERMLVETLVGRPRPWEEHLSTHLAVRDLLRVSSWRQLNFLSHDATRDDDPLRSIDGARHGRQWHRVDTSSTGIAGAAPVDGSPFPFLFTWEDVKAPGVRTWIRLRTDMGRALGPLVGLLALRGSSVEAHWSQLGIGLEGLGYVLARAAGVSRNKASDLSFEQRLMYVAQDTSLPTGFPVDDWVDLARQHYRAVKHADRPLPPPDELADSYYRGVLLFRAWLAGRLGVPAARFEQRLTLDPVARRT
jgi:hypothetical protein